MAKSRSKNSPPHKILDLFFEKNGLPIHGLYIPKAENFPPERLAEYESWKNENLKKVNEVIGSQKKNLLEHFILAIWVLSKAKPALQDGTLKDLKEFLTLDKGRQEGAQKNKDKAEEKQARIKKAIGELYMSSEGWKMSYEEIAAFLMERKLSPYSQSYTVGQVKKLAPAIKAKHKSGQ